MVGADAGDDDGQRPGGGRDGPFHGRCQEGGRVRFGAVAEDDVEKQYAGGRLGSQPAEVLELSDPGVLPVLRRHPVGPFLGLYNVTEQWRSWPAHRLAELGLGDARDVLAGGPVRPGDDGSLELAPYAALWVVARE